MDSNQSITQSLARLIDELCYGGKGERSLVAPPWEDHPFLKELQIPWHLKTPKLSGVLLGVGGGFVFIFAWIISSKLLGVMALGICATTVLARRALWLQSGKLAVTTKSGPIHMREHQTLTIPVQIHNTGSSPTEPTLLYVRFPGSTPPETYFVIDSIAAGQKSTVLCQFVLNAGMGEHRLESLQVILKDPIGLFAQAMPVEVDILVLVNPEYEAMPSVEFQSRGRSVHSGSFEARASGDSASILGLRPYRAGDSIRRIDWKRSHRHNDIVVRDFEQLNSTDAYVIVDLWSRGRFSYASVDSFEALKDSAVSVLGSLMDQQLRVSLTTAALTTHLGKGRSHFNLLCDLLRDLKPSPQSCVLEKMDMLLTLAPPDTVLVPIFFELLSRFRHQTSISRWIVDLFAVRFPAMFEMLPLASLVY